MLFTIWFPFWDKLSFDHDWLVLLLILRSVSAIFLLLFLKVSHKPVLVQEKKIYYWLLVVGVLDAIAYGALTWGYELSSQTSIIIVLGASYSVPTLILARIFLKEKLHTSQKIGIALILLGIAALAILK